MAQDEERIWLDKSLMGPLLRKLREERLKMSQEALGVALGYKKPSAQNTVSQIEDGKRPIPDAKLLKFARLANLPISYFMEEGVGGDGWQDGFVACLDQIQGVITTMRSHPAPPVSRAAAQAARAMQLEDRRTRRGNDR
jgi:transcriptional regulator with XRE-family HTH domain